MTWTFCRRAGATSVGFALAFGLTGTVAPAALDLSVGARTIVKSEPLSACNSKAKDTLTSVLGTAEEYGETGLWQGYGVTDASGNSFAAAAIHCYPLDQGYLVSFTCVTQQPTAPHPAADICAKLAASFGGQP